MRIGYNKLWKMLIDKGVNKMDLKEAADIITGVLKKMRDIGL